MGVPVELQRLVFGGRKLEDDKTLLEYNVQKGSLLHLTLNTPNATPPVDVDGRDTTHSDT